MGEGHWTSGWGTCLLFCRLQWPVCCHPDIYIPSVFIPLWKSKFPSSIISLQSEEGPLAFLEVQICWQQILFALMLKMSLWKDIFAGCGILGWLGFFFFPSSNLKILFHCVCPPKFTMRSLSLFNSLFIFLVVFRISSLIWFSKFDYDAFGYGCLCSVGVSWAAWICKFLSFTKFGMSSVIVLGGNVLNLSPFPPGLQLHVF